MSPGWLLVAPLLAALCAAAGLAAAGASGALETGTWAVRLGAQLLASVGTLAAAWTFDRRDYMFRAWGLTALSFLLPVLNRLTLGPHGDWILGHIPGREGFDLFLSLAVNACSVAGGAMFVAAFWASGLVPDGSRLARLVVGSIIVALVIGAPVFVLQVRDAATGSGGAASAAIGTAGDILAFALATPLLLVSLEFRGGALQWPWALLAGGNLGWLVYDVVLITGEHLGGGSAGWAFASEIVVVTASVASFSAGLAHRAAVRGVAVPRPIIEGS